MGADFLSELPASRGWYGCDEGKSEADDSGDPGIHANRELDGADVLAPDDLGTPAGGGDLRGAYNFQTPAGWDTVYTSIFNMIERPSAPALVIRVETDWYVHDTEFRYVLLPGETISASHNLPIGQAFFVPREKITLRDGTADEIAARQKSSEAFFADKATAKVKTGYGLEHSPHYLRKSRQQNAAPEVRATEDSGSNTP